MIPTAANVAGAPFLRPGAASRPIAGDDERCTSHASAMPEARQGPGRMPRAKAASTAGFGAGTLFPMPSPIRVGVISDTHGLLRPEAIDALRGSDHIIHAGDVGDEGILAALRDLAPVTAVRGNADRGAWARALPETVEVELGGVRLCVVHIQGAARFGPGMGALIYGHTHFPGIEMREGVLYLNPGSAGPRRFHLPVGLARILIRDGKAEAALVPLLPS